ncbi:MAG: hypothetical protein A4E62_02872 [Syntrophorhabdus sp. PtaU1.Bin002]|nr:MAG: hypothetical protein A4E58_01941 [Syntrophorhabdus sp. PtaB.Bin006]OPY64276.1 MAG: hypothetical protein A4E62_02872 [Syntrophorhabdus sp. PtaU1.Bin002]
MFYLCNASVRLHLCCKIPHIAGSFGNGGVGIYVYQGVLIYLPDKIFQIRLNIKSFQGIMKFSCHSSQFFLFFHQMHLVSLVGYGEGACHAAYASPYYHRNFVYRQVKFLQRLQMTNPGYRHPD